MNPTQLTITNPYVGPRTFTQKESNRYFGRERDARDLLSLVISQRLTLFYAQSGAGKSSLINTRLIAQLTAAGFTVLPVGRVGGELPTGVSNVANVFLFNLMLSLAQRAGNNDRLAQVSLTDYLDRLTSDDGITWYYDATLEAVSPAAALDTTPVDPALASQSQPAKTPYVLIIDQFEEILTTHPGHWQERELFFRQLNEAMLKDPNLWVVLTLREDYVPALEPYAPCMADKLRARYYMKRMEAPSALEAIEKPAALGRRPFAPGVAQSLVDNLRRIKVLGQEGEQLGQYIEPVQLQVVCYQLWENLKARPPGLITQNDLQEAGDIDNTLSAFYEDAIATVLRQSDLKIAERALRNWFSSKLITEASTRGTVYQGLTETAGMPNPIIRLLTNQFLLRTELRAGGAWVELVHDRFVEPILRANRAWLQRQAPLVRAAQAWNDAGRNPTQLYLPPQLADIHQTMTNELSDPLVAEFLAASETAAHAQADQDLARQREVELQQAQALARESEARSQAEAERAAEADARRREQTQAASRLRRLVVSLALLGVVALGLAGLAALSRWQAVNSAVEAERNALRAEAGSTAVAGQFAVAVAVQKTAEAERQAAETARASTFQLANSLSMLLTAQAPTATPVPASPTPTSQSDSPETPVVQTTPTVVPPSTPTNADLPVGAATVAVEAIQAQLEQVQATQTAAAPLQLTGTPTQTTLSYAISNLYLRAGPGTEYQQLALLPAGTAMQIVGENGEWYQVIALGQTGYVNRNYIFEAPQPISQDKPVPNLSLAKPFQGDYPVTQTFGENPTFYAQFLYDGVPLKGFNGIDFAVPIGGSILATDDGEVKSVSFEAENFGHYILLEHAWGESLYAHLDQVNVKIGQVVRRGDVIARSGNSGVANGPFLHFGIRINPYVRTDGWGGFSDPLPYLNLGQ